MSSPTSFHGRSPFPSTSAGGASAGSPPRVGLAALPAAGVDVDARAHVEPGTGLALGTVLAVLCLGLCLLALGAFATSSVAAPTPARGQALRGAGDALASVFTLGLVALILASTSVIAARKAKAILRASALRAGPRQFPEIHACAVEYARRLGLVETPEIYVLDSSTVNAFALKFKKRSMIVLTDETVAACLEGRSPGGLAFVLGHELAHVALGHTRWWRLMLRSYRKLARLDECSADNVACELVGSREAAQDGVLLLSVGPRLLSFVDRAAALEQAAEVAADRSVLRLERSLTHPLTLRRLDRVARRFGCAHEQRRAA